MIDSSCYRVKMCKVKMLKTLVKQRLNVAVEEIFELFERTIAEYEEEFGRARDKNERQQREPSDTVLKPQVPSHQADVQQVLVESQEEEPAEPACIKEEEEDMWSSQDGERLQALEEEADVNTFALTGVHLKSEFHKSRSPRPRHSRKQKNRGGRLTREPDGEHSQAGNFAPPTDVDDMMSLTSDSDLSDHPKKPLKTPKNPKGPITRHDNNKQFICSECGKIFLHRGTLNRHMRTHTGEKPFSCAVCTKKFSTNSDIKIHMRTHTGEKPFACSFCPQRFPIKSNMKIHVRVKHTGEKPFTCSVCPQRFARKSAMKLHVQVKHAGLKPFNCTLCPKRFSSNKNVMIHMRTHTGEKAFSCNVCAQRFSYKYQLDKHRCGVVDADAMSPNIQTW
ncbi:uncharacterized protein LOC144062327 [Vanacampus margaritifer]